MPSETPDVFREIVARAANLSERIAAYRGDSSRTDEPDGDDLRHVWMQAVAPGDGAAFERRLKALQLDTEDVPACLQAPELLPDALPSWCQVLVSAMGSDHREPTALDSELPASPQIRNAVGPDHESVGAHDVGGIARSELGWDSGIGEAGVAEFIDSRPKMLPELTSSLIGYAMTELARSHSGIDAGGSDPLKADLALWLQARLARILTPTVASEFAADRLELIAQGSTDPWRAWMAAQRREGLLALWQKYPALARLVGTTVENWLARVNELLDRAGSDATQIAATFGRTAATEDPRSPSVGLSAAPNGTGRGIVTLVGVAGGLSDPHNGGSTVVRCTFEAEDSTRFDVIYKPRDIGAEVEYARFQQWMNDRGVDVGEPLILRANDGYGWVECVENAPAETSDDVELYFRRCGVLAAMLFALGATDCTTENLIAATTRPTIIDAETLLHPHLRPPASSLFGVIRRPAAGLPRTRTTPGEMESVLDTLLLPRWMPVLGRVVDLSAMGSSVDEVQPWVPQLRWVGAGTADARVELTYAAALTRNSDLRGPNGDVQLAHTYRASVLEGFDEGWAAIAEHGQELFDPGGPLAQLADVQTRVLLRMTGMYIRLLDASLDPQLLTDGVRRSLHLERLARYWLNHGAPNQSLAIATAEREQAEAGDVPIFITHGASRAMRAGLSATARASSGTRDRTSFDEATQAPTDAPAIEFIESPVERARRRVAAMSFAERERQRNYVRAALAVAEPNIRATALACEAQAPSDEAPSSSAVNDELRQHACRKLVEQMMRAVTPISGGANIMSLNATSRSQWSIAPLDASLGHGVAGVALSLLIAGRTTGDPYAQALAVSLLRPSLEHTLANLDRHARVHGAGLERGLGGLRIGWSAARELVTSDEMRGDLSTALDQLDRHRLARTDPAANAELGLSESSRTGDMLVDGIAGTAELLRAEHTDAFASPLYAQMINSLAVRAVDANLSLGIPRGCPIAAFGLNYGLAGVLYALAAATPADNAPNLPLQCLTD